MRAIRRSIFILVLIFLSIGVVMIYSSSAIYASERFGDSDFFLKRHTLFLVIGFISMLVMMSLDLNSVRLFSKPAILIAIMLLSAVLIPGIGVTISGARRWFRIENFSFQPSEFAKFALILYLADFLARKGYEIKDLLKGYMPSIFIIALLTGLVMLEPDLGTAACLFFIGIIMIFFAGANIKHLLVSALAGLPFFIYLILCVPYRMRRILTFLNPWADRQGAGFQIVQSFLALGSGGFLGVGLGHSKQKLFYLPESHTDFIFSIIGEELGFIGAASLVALFALFVWLGIRAVLMEDRQFNKILIFGITSIIAFEVLVNIGVGIGSIPTKGLPLPFISYGGSSLVFHMAAVGLMLNAMRE